MVIKTKKGDFIELDFSAYSADGKLIDTTLVDEAKKAGLLSGEKEEKENKKKFEPLVICIGEGMVLKGFDKELEDKEINKDYEIVLKAEDAFGKRNAKLIKTAPLSAFQEMPQIGMFVNVDGIVAKVISITSGRVLLDFNHPLAGKEIKYRFKINSLVIDNKKKIRSIGKMFGIDIEKFDIIENKVKIKNLKNIDKEILDNFKRKVKELIGVELTVE